MEKIIDKSKKSKGPTVWDAKVDKRLAEVKAQAKKNGNHFIFVLTAEELKPKKGSQGTKVEGMMVSHMFNVARATEMFLASVPEDAVKMVLMKKALGDLGDILSSEIIGGKKNG